MILSYCVSLFAMSVTCDSDAYNEIAASHMTEWEKDREKEEFSKAAMFYKPMTSMMASRFTRAKYHDDDEKAKMPAQEVILTNKSLELCVVLINMK